MYYSKYISPIGEMTLISKDNKLIGLYLGKEFNNLQSLEKKYKSNIVLNDDLEIFFKTKTWLDKYFAGKVVHTSELELDLNLIGTEFEQSVWKYIYEIPYGEITTYKKIADKVKKDRNKEFMAAQAIGRAVGRNPISIINPCHRVVGSKGDIVGYASGIDNKIFLLNLEKINLKKLFKKK